MTSDDRLALLEAKAEKHTKAHAASKDAAVRALVSEGLYTKKGDLSPNFGGAVPVASKKRV